jgi:multidrug efflux pump subunit AcrB
MTSLATIAGLLPTALGLEASTASNRPLALAVVGGLTSSTMLSLFLVPAMFLLIAKRSTESESTETGPSAVPAAGLAQAPT